MKAFSPVTLLLQLLLVGVLLAGNYFYVRWFTGTVEPAARAAVERRLGVSLDRNLMGWWSVRKGQAEESGSNRAWLELKTLAINFALVLAFVAVFIAELLLLVFLSIKLFKSSFG